MTSVKKVGAVALAASLALGLGACSAQPGVALKLNGRTYTEAEIDEGLAQYNALLEGTSNDFTKTDFVWILAGSDLLIQYGENVGLMISDEDVDEVLAAQTAEEFVAFDGDYADSFLQVVKWNLTYSAVSQTELDADLYAQLRARQQVTVNPRYGDGQIDSTTGHYALATFGDARTVTDLLADSESATE